MIGSVKPTESCGFLGGGSSKPCLWRWSFHGGMAIDSDGGEDMQWQFSVKTNTSVPAAGGAEAQHWSVLLPCFFTASVSLQVEPHPGGAGKEPCCHGALCRMGSVSSGRAGSSAVPCKAPASSAQHQVPGGGSWFLLPSEPHSFSAHPSGAPTLQITSDIWINCI